MIFFSKRHNAPEQASTTEACVSILGLILAIGLIGGVGALIYGLVKGILSATIGGGIVLGVSAVFSVILALVFVYCLKNNDVDSNVNEQRSLPHQQNRHQKQHRQINREQTSSREITVVSEIHKYDNQKQYSPNGYSLNQLSPSVQSIGLTHSTNSGFGRQLPQSPSKTSSFYFNQNNGSMVNQNQQANIKRNNYNRH